MHTIYQNIKKATDFKVFIKFYHPTEYARPTIAQINDANTTCLISKDGGSFTATSNPPVGEDTQLGSVQLTSSEMDANIIVLRVRTNPTSTDGDTWASAMIFTDGYNASGYGYSPGVITVISQLAENDYSLVDIKLGESGYNYYGLKSSNTWYIIIRETTNGTEIMYHMNKENRTSYDNSWSNRASLSYKDTLPRSLLS